jgi:mitogen-activated protein kinase 1/3
MKNNVFTTKLLDVILPPEAEESLLELTHLFLVQDFVEHDLKKLFTVDTPPNFSDMHVMVILYNLLCALNYIHTANLMHRDLKPANILINDECAVKLCDFGLSRTVPVYEDDANKQFINAQLQAAEQSDNS